jgi:ATP-dependent RNA helicase DDX21
MLTRRKSSEHVIEPPVTKKVKKSAVAVEAVAVPASNLKEIIHDVKTRRILKARGIASLFPIQVKTYKPIFDGSDLIGQDRTGSGKTLAYALPLSERLRGQGLYGDGQKGAKVLVMVPTRELALQVTKEIETLKHNEHEFKAIAVYGGTFIREQIIEIKRGAEWIIGTPGRLLDLLNRKVLDLTQLKTIILDEADQMLQFGIQSSHHHQASKRTSRRSSSSRSRRCAKRTRR